MNLFEKIKKFFGYNYLVNLNTLEIHDLNNPHTNCKTNLITNKKMITKKQLNKYLANGYNGCRWCLKKHNNG